MKDRDLGWLAGVLDSEGAIGIRSCSGGASLEPIVQMETTCEATAQRVVALSGQLGVSARSYRVRARNPKHRNSFALRITRLNDVAILARAMEPAAITKKAQWKVVRQFCASRLRNREIDDSGRVKRGGAGRFPYTDREVELWQSMKDLNVRGAR